MVLKQVMEIFDIIDKPQLKAKEILELFNKKGCQDISSKTIEGKNGEVELIKIILPGQKGKAKRGNNPTINIIGQLGGLGSYPTIKGFISDGDGALTALSVALKIAEMQASDCYMEGDVIITTHICSTASVTQRKPVSFMDMPLPIEILMEHLVIPEADAVISIDTTKGNRILNQMGFAITPTVKEGYILKVSDDLMDIMSTVTGELPSVIAITTQDITSYNNTVYHLNSIMQPALFTNSPVFGVAITTQLPVAGNATGATSFTSIEMATRFCIEVAKIFGSGRCKLFDNEEYEKLLSIYGSLKHFQKF